MDSIITYLLLYHQYLLNIKHIPLKQLAFDHFISPNFQNFKVDKLPTIIFFEKVDYVLLLACYKHTYGKVLRPINRRNGKAIPEHLSCPKCGVNRTIKLFAIHRPYCGHALVPYNSSDQLVADDYSAYHLAKQRFELYDNKLLNLFKLLVLLTKRLFLRNIVLLNRQLSV